MGHRILLTTVTGAALALAALATPATASSDDDAPPALLELDDFEATIDEQTLRAATWEYGTNSVTQFDLDRTVQQLETIETEGETVVVTLASDVLFDVDSAELAPAVAARAAELVRDIPQGATVTVDGHTDSVADDAHNQDLSERRAQAVANVIAAERADLVLEVHGYGESDLKVAESGDDVADDRAQNRRVELSYRSTGSTTTTTEPTDAALAGGEYVPGAGPVVTPLDEDAVVVEHEVVVPGGDGERVRVGVEAITVRGPVMRLRVQLTPLDDGEYDRWSVFGMTGEGELHVQLFDVDNLITYRQARYAGQIEWETATTATTAAVDQTVRYETYLARPVEKVDTLDVSIVPEWPRFEDIPVTWD